MGRRGVCPHASTLPMVVSTAPQPLSLRERGVRAVVFGGGLVIGIMGERIYASITSLDDFQSGKSRNSRLWVAFSGSVQAAVNPI